MAKEELQIVGVKVMLEDRREIEPPCWAMAYLQKGEEDKPLTHCRSWSRREHSAEEILLLGVAIERLLSEYSEDDAIKGALLLLESKGDIPSPGSRRKEASMKKANLQLIKELKGKTGAQSLLNLVLTPDVIHAAQETYKQGKRTVVFELHKYHSTSLEVLMAIYEQYKTELEERSHYFMLAQRFEEAPNSLQWAILDMTCGAYYNAAQMLRLIFESTLQAFCLQQTNPANYKEAVLEAKRLDERHRSFGKGMIQRLWLPQKLRVDFEALYQELCALSHSSADFFEKRLKEEQLLLEFKYDAESFDRCARPVRQVMEAVFTVILKAFPKVRDYGELTDDAKSILTGL